MVLSGLFFVVEVEGGGWRYGVGERSRLCEASWNLSRVEWKLSWELRGTRCWRRSAMVGCWLEVKLFVICCVQKGPRWD